MKKHICMVAYAYYLTDARVRREAETLASVPSYEVTVLVLKGENLPPQKYTKNGVRIQELNINKYRGSSNLRYFLSYFRFLINAFFTCTDMLIRKSLDIIHIHNMPNFLIFSAIIPLIFGKKIILDIHDTMLETYSAKFQGWGSSILLYALRLEEAVCCAMAHRIVCVNHIQRDVLVKRGIPQDKMILSMNVPDPRIFRNNKVSIGKNLKKDFKLVYFGTITKRLGIDLAIRAVAKLNGKIPDFEFHIMGGGDDIQEFIDLTRDLQIESVIRFYEKAFYLEELIKVLEDMDLVVIPNRRNEATELMLPVKMLESVVLGIPIVAPRLKTIEYYFSDDQVFYFEPDNVKSMADAIFYAYNNEVERIKKAQNAKAFLEKYGWETHKHDLLNLYESLT